MATLFGPQPYRCRALLDSAGASATGRRLLGAVGIAALVLTVSALPARAERPHVYAITSATVIVAPGQSLEGATVVVRDGLVESVAADAPAPADAEVIDGAGLTVYAGWIDAYSHLGMRQRQGGGGGGFDFAALFQQGPPEPGTGHPIELVHPQHRVTDELVPGEADIARRRELGFTAALTVPRDGIYRGWSTLIALGDGPPRDLVIEPVVGQHVGFDRGSFLGGYPADLLGSIATLRQVHYDVVRYLEWTERYAAHPLGMQRPAYNDAFAALVPVYRGERPMIAHAGSNDMLRRALRLADELGADPILYGSGFEYEILDALRDSSARLIVPVAYPDEPDVSEERAPYVSLETLQRWQGAPGNAAALESAGITFALTPFGMSNASRFGANVRKAIAAGLSADTALAAVTTVPAAMLGVDAVLGTVEAGKIANLVVATGAPFGEDTEIRYVFVDGIGHELEAEEQVGDPDAVVDPRGEWAVVGTVMGQSQNATWTIAGSEGDYSGRSVSEQGEIEFESVTLEGNVLTVVIPQPGGRGTLEATVVIEGDELTGSASVDLPDGQTLTIDFKGERVSGPQDSSGGAR